MLTSMESLNTVPTHFTTIWFDIKDLMNNAPAEVMRLAPHSCTHNTFAILKFDNNLALRLSRFGLSYGSISRAVRQLIKNLQG